MNSIFSVPCWIQVFFSNLKAPKTSKALQFPIFVNKKSTVKHCKTLFIKKDLAVQIVLVLSGFFIFFATLKDSYSHFTVLKSRMGYSFFESFIEGLIIRDIRDYQAKALCLDFHKVIGVFFRNLLFAICFINFTMLKRPNVWEIPRKFSKEYFYQEYQWLLNRTSLCLNFQNVFVFWIFFADWKSHGAGNLKNV